MDITSVIEKMDYGELTVEIRRTMRRSARDAVQLGFMLRRVAEGRLWETYHDSFDGYLREGLRMDYSLASRFMKINEKYSVSGKSMDIKPEYEGYSQGALIEMLNLPPELEEKVSPEMTVREVREIKRKAKPKKEMPVPKREETETVIDGEYREVPQEAEEKVATSQPGAPEAHDDYWFVRQYMGMHPAEAEGMIEVCLLEGDGSERPKALQKYISPYGSHHTGCSEWGFDFNSFAKGVDMRIGSEKRHFTYSWFTEVLLETAGQENTNGSDGEGKQGEDETCVARKLLAEERALLDGYMEAGDIPEMTVLRQKIKVEALAAMVESLEAHTGEEETVQPEPPVLKNNDRRKEWLRNYAEWGLWYRDENIDVNYYKYDFRDGSRLVVAEYPQRQDYYRKDMADEYYFHLLEKGKEGYGGTRYGEKYRNAVDSESYLVEFLKNLQKKG